MLVPRHRWRWRSNGSWSQMLAAVLLIAFDLAAAQAQQAPPAVRKPKVWLYSLVSADHDGARLLPHWIKWYNGLGIPYETFVLDVLHDPAISTAGLKQVLALLHQHRIAYRLLELSYTPDLQDRAVILTLAQFLRQPDDWLVVADADEFFDYGAAAIGDLLAQMDAEGATFAKGEMLDRVHANGTLAPVEPGPEIWEQFPLTCPLVKGLGKGLPVKITIFKGFLRVGAGHHFVVEPDWAKQYFGEICEGPKCDYIMNTFRTRSNTDLYLATPYAQYQDRYKEEEFSLDVMRRPWVAREFSRWSTVYHFKWHAGIVGNLRARAARDSGNCRLGVNEDTCTPRFPFWREVARQYQHVKDHNALDVSQWHCTRKARGEFHSFLRDDPFVPEA